MEYSYLIYKVLGGGGGMGVECLNFRGENEYQYILEDRSMVTWPQNEFN